MLRRSILFSACLAGMASCVTFAVAQDLPAPSDVTILTVTGAISKTNVGATLQFDRVGIMALPAAIIETSTIWTEGVHKFQGVSLKTLVDLLGVTEGTILATAINDYTVEIPVADAINGGPIVAYLLDDAEMPVRKNGPLWVIYPYDSSPDYRTEVTYSRSVWQLDRLEIVK